MVDADDLSDTEATQMLEGLDVTEARDGIQQLHRSRGKTWDPRSQEVEEFSVFGVHDGPLDELHHRMTAVFELRVTPQAKRASVVLHARVVCDALRPEAQTEDVAWI